MLRALELLIVIGGVVGVAAYFSHQYIKHIRSKRSNRTISKSKSGSIL